MEQNRKDEDEAAIEEALQEQKAKSDRRLTDKEDLMTIRHPMAKKINHVLFENAPARNIDNFLDGKLTLNWLRQPVYRKTGSGTGFQVNSDSSLDRIFFKRQDSFPDRRGCQGKNLSCL